MTKVRALVKATSWRIVGSTGTILTAWWLSGEFRLAAAIGGIEFFLKIGMFYLHERAWERMLPAVIAESPKGHRESSVVKDAV